MTRKPYVGPLGPEQGMDDIVLTVREQATLRSAALILHMLRKMRDHEDDDIGTDIALAAYTIDDLGGRVSA